MQLMSTDDVPRWDVVRTFRYRPWAPLFIFIVFFAAPAIPVGLLLTGVLPLTKLTGQPAWVWIVMAPIALVALLVDVLVLAGSWRAFTASLLPTSWIMKVTRSGVYLRFRSYVSDHSTNDGTGVVYVPFAEIASVRRWTEWVKSGRSSRDSRSFSFLEIHLSGVDTGPLREAIARETAHKVDETKGLRVHFSHVPIRVRAPGIIQVEWRGKSMLTVLRDRVAIEQPHVIVDGVPRINRPTNESC